MVLEELARRAFRALENARLYDEVEREAQAAGVLASVADGVFLVDRRGRIQLWNRAAETYRHRPAVGDTSRGSVSADVLPGWADLVDLIPVVATPGTEDSCRETLRVPLEPRRQGKVWLAISGVALGCGDGVCVPRPDGDPRGRGDEERLRRDGLPRAAHAAGGDLRRGG